MNVFVTGGLGFIGSHTAIQLLEAGHSLVVLDNLSNSDESVVSRIEEIALKEITFYKGDIRDEKLLDQIFVQHKIDAVIHFAGLKAVGESVAKPIAYYDNNVTGSLVLMRAMQRADIKRIVFSSSATVYGDPEVLPITEDQPVGAVTNPYGRSKLMVEQCLQDVYQSDNSWSISILRYFNPVGAHSSGLIGEDPIGTPNNLTPFIAKVASGELEELSIFGDDYDTPDGTGIRDFIHVVDLADGHVASLDKMAHVNGIHIFNLGTGKGYSVLEMVEAFKQASKKNIPYKICPRRHGDIAQSFASTEKAEKGLDWKAHRSIMQMAEDAWNWRSNRKKEHM